MWGVKAVEVVTGLTMWGLPFPHQGLSSSSWWASWAHRTANTLSATQNRSEMPQRHRLELCRGTGDRDGCRRWGWRVGLTRSTLPTSDEHLDDPRPMPGLSTHVNACGVEGTVRRQRQQFRALKSAGSQQCLALGGKGHGDGGQEAKSTGQRQKGTGHARTKHCPSLERRGHWSTDVGLDPHGQLWPPWGQFTPSKQARPFLPLSPIPGGATYQGDAGEVAGQHDGCNARGDDLWGTVGKGVRVTTG